MKRKQIISLVICFVLAASALCVLTSCANTPFTPRTDYDVTSDSLYVKKVDNIADDFVMGMDSSQVLALEASGVKYYDYDGTETDVFKILADNGINTIRVRVWNDPFDADGHGYGGGNCTIDTAVAIGKRANKYKMNLMVDFHYSDFWADPNKQQVPKAWAGMKLSEKIEALNKYTEDSLKKLKNAGVRVNIAQVGNETNGKLCGESDWMSIAKLMNAGAEAIRKVYPNAMVAVHFANPEKSANFKDYAAKLDNFNVDYDIFASSYYPYWHGTLDNLSTVLSEIATKYNKKVMVAETSYAFTAEDTDFSGNTIGEGSGVAKPYPYTIQGQTNSVRNVIEAVAKTTNGIGVCYWEGTWISVGGDSWEENSALWEKYGSGWASSYSAQYDPNDAGKYYGGCAVDNQAFFDKDGKALESLKVWALVRKGNVVDIKADALEDASCAFIIGDEIELPATVNAIMSDDSKQPQAVTWDVTKEQLADIVNSGAGRYTVTGKVGDQSVKCVILIKESNYLNNGGFEEDANEELSPSGWVTTGSKNSASYKALITTENPWEGNNAFHWWASNGNVQFSLEQEALLSKAGSYKFTVRVMGSADKNQNIIAYVKVDGQIVKQVNIVKDGFQSNPDLWQVGTVEFDITQATSVTVGISVDCKDSGTWGDIDDLVLCKVEN